MGSRRAPNHLLRALLREAGWTGQALARTVNALGFEAGLPLQYDRTTVAHWLSGALPRHPVPELVAEGLSRELGRRVTVAETGLVPRGPRVADTGAEVWRDWHAGERLAELARVRPGRPGMYASCVYSTAALAVPSWADLVAAPATRRLAQPVTTGRIGHAEVDSAAAMVRLFADADSTFGGGYPRVALGSYLATTIAPWLRADASTAVRHELLATATRLTYLCAFMCFDENLHGAAQRYYLISLRLAGEAGDAVSYGVILRALSVQARLLGHRRPAVGLADEAVRTASGRAPRQTRAFLHGQAAVAHAAAGNRRDALGHLNAAETHLSHADGDTRSPATPLIGGYHLAAFAHCQAATTACLGDRRGAIAALRFSIRHRPSTEPRSRAVTLARLAELQLAEGQLEQACGTWQEFLDHYPSLRSRRADAALTTLLASTNPYRNNPVARALHLRANAVRRATARHTGV